MTSNFRVAIGAVTAPNYVGGLAAYERGLARALEHFGGSGVLVSIYPQHPVAGFAEEKAPWPLKFASSQKWDRADRLMQRLASRPPLHGVLETVISLVLSPRSLREFIGEVDWIHFVGAGRLFMGFSLMRLARSMGVPFTSWPAVHPGDWGDDKLDIRFFNKCDAVFCQTANERDHLSSLGVEPARLVLCGLPAMCRSDGNAESLRKERDLGSRPCVLFIGRRDEGKGYPAMLKAWPAVLERCPEACLLLCGPGDPRTGELSALPAGSYRDLGVASEQLKADALSACNVFCLPSSHESFGIAYVEAWSYAKPVIVGTAPACRELVGDGVGGLWADQNPSNLAAKIVQLLQDPELASRLGAHGHALQQERFSWDVVARTHLQAAGLTAKKTS